MTIQTDILAMVDTDTDTIDASIVSAINLISDRIGSTVTEDGGTPGVNTAITIIAHKITLLKLNSRSDDGGEDAPLNVGVFFTKDIRDMIFVTKESSYMQVSNASPVNNHW